MTLSPQARGDLEAHLAASQVIGAPPGRGKPRAPFRDRQLDAAVEHLPRIVGKQTERQRG